MFLLEKFRLIRSGLLLLVALLIIAPHMSIGQIQDYAHVVKKGHTDIPFEYINGFIIVDVLFQKIVPMKFIFDTGAEYSVLFKPEYITALQIPCSKKVRLVGTDLNTEIWADICSGVYLQVSSVQSKLQQIIVLDEDYTDVDEFIGKQISGILGADYFHNNVVSIDYKKMLITIIESTSFIPEKYHKYESFDLDIINNKPYLNCRTSFTPDSTKTMKMLIDTGAGISAIFHYNDTLNLKKEKWIQGVLGKGLSGDIAGYVGRVHSFQFGSFEFGQMISSFQWFDEEILKNYKIVKSGLIGNVLLERFHLVIDYPSKKLYIKPIKKYNQPFEYDKSGLTIYAYGDNLNQYYIKHILTDSPAYKAGLLENDIILKINGWSYKLFSLKKINKKLSAKAGRKVTLKIKRGDQTLKKQIILKDLF